MESKIRNLFKKYWIAIGIILILVGLILRIISIFFNNSLLTIIGEVGTFLAVSVAVAFIYDLFLKEIDREIIFNDLSKLLDSKIDQSFSKESLNWLYSIQKIADLESNINVPLIWVLTSDLSHDIIGGYFQKIVENNLKRGVKYRYFLPDNPENQGRVKSLRIYYNDNPDVSFTFLKVDFFIISNNFQVIIYNPFKQNDGQRDGFITIPSEIGDKPYYAKVTESFIDTAVGQMNLFP